MKEISHGAYLTVDDIDAVLKMCRDKYEGNNENDETEEETQWVEEEDDNGVHYIYLAETNMAAVMKC